MKNSLLDKLMPKESRFFPMLRQMGAITIDAADLLIKCLESRNHDEAVGYFKEIREKEHEGDVVSSAVFDELNSSFITPFDREDIHLLADTMDDVIDGINSCAKRIVLYKPKSIPPSAVEQARLIREAGGEIALSMEALEAVKKSPDKIMHLCNNLYRIEGNGDGVYEKYIQELFGQETDAVEIIKLKEIAWELEKTIDTSERVAKIIKTIIVKYA